MTASFFALLWLTFSATPSWAGPEVGLDKVAKTLQPQLTTTPMGSLPSDLIHAARDYRNLPLSDRMDKVSQPMLGKPYVADPLGEGRGFDKDPVVRYDLFDCLTFVEEVLALSLSGDPIHAGAVRTKLRYSGNNIYYKYRKHFMELQWIPDNVRAGWLKDTTAEYGPTTTMTKLISYASWGAWNRRKLFALKDRELPVGQMSLRVLPLDTALEAAANIRPGSLILTVRADRPTVPIWITHLGFTVPREEPTIRHASRMKSAMDTRDHSLVWYLEHLKTYVNWPTAGIAILEPIEQGPRRSALASKQSQ